MDGTAAPNEDPGPPDGDEDAPEEIPRLVLAAIKDRMHARRMSPPDDPGHLEVSLGTAEDDIHLVDDGPEHCMIGRAVGYAPDGCVYVLVGRIARYRYEQLADGDVQPAQAFDEARDMTLCGVYEVDGMVENIAPIRRFRRVDDVPADYLPPAPFLEFSEENSPTDED
jgi:hypothetical protein